MEKACLIGGRLKHSYSKIIHEKLGYGYDLLELAADKVGGFVKEGGYDCFNVTIPYKKTVMEFLDVISEEAQAIGAVNTVVRRGGKLYGFNTDMAGFGYMFERDNVSVGGKKVLILGSGGTGVMAEYYAKKEGASEVTVVSREGENNYQNIGLHSDAQIIINATPVGMYPDNGVSPVNLEVFKNLAYVVDVIYNPLMTKLLLDAARLNIKHRGGMLMLVAQAVYSKALYTDKAVEKEDIERVYAELVYETRNVVLAGMPSSGKSTVGAELARQTGRLYVDTDKYIEDMCGKSVSEIFSDDGEAYFRAKELKVIEAVGKERGQVIALGGGALTNAKAYDFLKQNGVLVYLKRDEKFADFSGRPLLTDKNAYEKLLLERLPIYEQYADITVCNNCSIENTLKELLEKL